MTFRSCLAKLKDEGVIDAARAERFGALFDEIESGFKKRFGDTPAAVLAGEETLKALDYDVALRRRQAALQITAQKKALGEVEKFDSKGDGSKAVRAVRGMIARYVDVPFANVESRGQAIEFEMQGRIAEFIHQHQRDWRGRVRNPVELDDIVRARHGEKVDNPQAQAMSDAIGGVFDELRMRFNALGGDIGHDAKFGLPHRWDAARVRADSFEAFRDNVLPELDLGRMADPKTGLAFTERGIDDALRAVYETIRTDGFDGLGEASVGGSRKLADRRSDARFLQFRNADGWKAVNDKYGSADPFSAIVDHVSGMARDIAMMERFGPNPDATVKWLGHQASLRLGQGPDKSPHALNRAKAAPKAIDELWAEVSGQNSVPVLGGPIHSGSIRGLHAARDLVTSAKLGKAAISAWWGDMGNIKVIKAFNGLPHSSELMGYIREMKPSSAADRALAAELELGMQDAAHGLIGLNRYFGQSQAPATTKLIADRALRITGLNRVTRAGQAHFSKTFMWALGRESGKAFDAVPERLRGAMERYGIDAKDWDAMRAAPLVDGASWDSRKFMSPRKVREINPAAAEKLTDLVLSERAAAVIESSARGRSLLNFGNPGTFKGEASRSLLQFKSFTASMMMVQGERIMADARLGPMYGAMYAARLFITMTVFGAAIVQTRQISKGEDPRPMDGWEFWADAMVAGGGIGIIGDVIGTYKQGDMADLGDIASGPLVGAVSDVGKLVVGNGFKAARGKETKVGRDLVELLRKNTPGSSTWYAGIAFQRLIIDNLRSLADPDYRDAWRKMDRRAREQGTGFWWGPGDVSPERAPDFANAFEQPAGEPAQ